MATRRRRQVVVLLPSPIDALEALLAGKGRAVTSWVLEAVAAGQGVSAVHREFVVPILIEIGERWERGQLTIADEHYCTTALHSLLVRLYAFIERAPGLGLRVLLAGVEGNAHALALHLLADQFEMAGWEAIFIGADTPVAELVELAARRQVHVVGLGASMADQRPAVEAAIAGVRAAPGLVGTRILVGGRGAHSWTAAMIGADAVMTDAFTAPAVAEALVRAAGAPARARPERGALPPMAGAGAAPVALAQLQTDAASLERALAAHNRDLELANAAQRALIVGATEELRDPLMVIQAAATELVEALGASVPPVHADTLGDLQQGCARAIRIVDHLVGVVRAESAAAPTRFEEINVSQLAADAIGAWRAAATAKRIMLSPLAPTAPPVSAYLDGARLRVALEHYLANAVHFSFPGGTIDVTLAQDGDAILIAVTDDGPGVSPAERQRLFKPFARAAARPTAGEASSGLGLAVVASIVAWHGGSCGVDDGPTRGARFWMRVPRGARQAFVGPDQSVVAAAGYWRRPVTR